MACIFDISHILLLTGIFDISHRVDWFNILYWQPSHTLVMPTSHDAAYLAGVGWDGVRENFERDIIDGQTVTELTKI